MKLNYYQEPNSNPIGSELKRPLIPIRLWAKGRRATTMALLDSGADISLFHWSLGKKLALDTEVSRAAQVMGIAGEPVTAYFYILELQIIGAPERISVEVGFTNSPNVTALLGQSDFFEYYKITFERYREQIEIKPAKKS